MQLRLVDTSRFAVLQKEKKNKRKEKMIKKIISEISNISINFQSLLASIMLKKKCLQNSYLVS